MGTVTCDDPQVAYGHLDLSGATGNTTGDRRDTRLEGR